MKFVLAWGVALLAIGLVVPAHAQTFPRDVGVYFDPNGDVCTVDPLPFTFDLEFWVLAFDLDGGIEAYEFGLDIDPRITVLSSSMVHAGNPINVGQAPADWIVGIGACLDGSGVFPLVEYTWGYVDPGATDMTICLRASSPSSFVPPLPGYLQCTGSLVTFGYSSFPGDYPPGCSVAKPTGTLLCEPPVTTAATTWSALKTSY